jgi:hypothetical protein
MFIADGGGNVAAHDGCCSDIVSIHRPEILDATALRDVKANE